LTAMSAHHLVYRLLRTCQIADILNSRGDLDEALRVRTEEELPVYVKLGDVRLLLVGRANLAMYLQSRNRPGDRAEARRLLLLALAAAEKLRVPEAEQIRALSDCWSRGRTRSSICTWPRRRSQIRHSQSDGYFGTRLHPASARTSIILSRQ